MPYFLISLGCAVVALIAFGEGYRRGTLAHPDTARAQAYIAELTAENRRYNAEAEARETRAYERGRLDQAEVEAAQRSERATRGARTRQDRRVNRVTGQEQPVPGAAPEPFLLVEQRQSEAP